jgi:hypothetical protein
VSWLLAHQGGWDEILWVAGPLLAVAAMLWLANRRANTIAKSRRADPADQAVDTRRDP